MASTLVTHWISSKIRTIKEEIEKFTLSSIIYNGYQKMCAQEDSNLHAQKGHQVLNLARLPIPPRAHLR